MPSSPEFGRVQEIGCIGMLACAVAALGLLAVAGVYTLSTGEALQLPMREVVIGWFAALAVFEVMAFGWLIVRLALIAGVAAATVALIIEGVRDAF